MSSEEEATTRVLLDIPTELLLLILEHCPYDELCSVRRSAKPLRALVRQTLNSHVWRSRTTNAALLQLSQLAAQHVDGETLKGLSGGVRSLHLQGDLLAVGSKDNCARVFGLRTSTCFAEFTHPHWVGAASLSPDASFLATGCDDCCVRIWPLELKRQAEAALQLRSTPHITAGGAIVGVHWLDGGRVLSCSQSGALTVWDAAGDHQYQCPSDRRMFGETLNGPVSCFGARGGMAVAGCVSGGQRRQPRLCVVRAGVGLEWSSSTQHPVTSVCIDRAEPWTNLIATGGTTSIVEVWDVRRPQGSVQQLVIADDVTGEQGTGGTTTVRAVSLCSPLLVIACADTNMLSVYDLRKCGEDGHHPPRVAKLRAHTNNDALALDAPRGRIACGGRMNEVRVWTTRF